MRGFVLALALGVLGCAGGPAVPELAPLAVPDAGRGAPDLASFGDLRAEAASLLAGAIRLPTPNPPGNEARLAHWLAQTLAQVPGVEARVISLAGPDSPRAALWARVRGTGARRPLLLLSHIDVAPAPTAEWAVDPWAGVVGGGYVVGRGALDAKGVTVVHLLTLVALARRAAPPARDIILLATPDEEAGGLEGARLLTRDRVELLGDAEFLLTEGGAIRPATSGTARAAGASDTRTSRAANARASDIGASGTARAANAANASAPDIWSVSFTEKTPCWVELRARGTPGHSALAAQQNASARLVRALARLQALEFPVRVEDSVQAMFRALAPYAPAAERAHYRDLRAALRTRPAFRARFLADPGLAALVRDTLAITVLEGSARVNMTTAVARAQLDARLLPGARCADFVARADAQIADPQVTTHVLLAFQANASPTDTALLRAIARVAARAEPRGVVVPRVNTGSGDAHWFRELGIHSYGFVPHRLQPEETRGVHGPNERISMDNLVLGVTTLLEIIDEL